MQVIKKIDLGGGYTGTLKRINVGSGDNAIYKIVAKMKELAVADSASPEIKKLAQRIEIKCGNNQTCKAFSAFETVAGIVKYKYDKDIVKFFIKNPKDPNRIEFIFRPKFYAARRYDFGDCDDLATFYASLCLALGLKVNFAIIAHGGSNQYSHVYNEVLLKADDGRYYWVFMDLVKEYNGKNLPGWAKKHIRKKTFEVK